MLDKTIPYAEIWMYLPQNIPITEPSLPEGFHFEFYQPGDELDWATIETAVLEFEKESQAVDYFKKKFSPYSTELKQRMLFVVTSSGEKVGTCTAWWKEVPNGTRYPLVHWVAVKPGYQGRGLARAMMNYTLILLKKLESTSPAYLHTQTWSHVAIRFYQQLGFVLSDKNLDGSPNPDYLKTIEILEKINAT